MDERTFLDMADAVMSRLEQVIEAASDAADAECDIELQPGGVIELEFADSSKIIINRHAAAREIWVAAKAGGFHFRHDGSAWVGTRDGKELHAALSGLISAQSGSTVVLPGQA